MPVGKILKPAVKLDVMLRVHHAYKLMRGRAVTAREPAMKKHGLSLFSLDS